MNEFMSLVNVYVRAELMILVPVLYFLQKLLVKTKLAGTLLPLVLAIISVLMSGIYTFATVSPLKWHSILLAIFMSVSQGILISGAASSIDTIKASVSFIKCGCLANTDSKKKVEIITDNAGISEKLSGGKGPQ